MQEITTKTPARIILSGEYSVIYGKPALVMAIDHLNTNTRICNHEEHVSFCFANLKYQKIFTLEQRQELKEKIDANYIKFLQGGCSIRDVLGRASELLLYTFIYMHERLKFKLDHGLKIEVNSNIPIGSGFGSSAVSIVGLMHALANYFSSPITKDDYLQFGRDIEKLQHGYSSGLDLYPAIYGSCIKFSEEGTVLKSIPQLPIYLVDTGKPRTTTGECVNFAAKYFRSSNLANDFAGITNQLDEALENNNLAEIKECIRSNHDLLYQIGVVPEKVQNFITKIKKLGGAAKICGAGACVGQNAGAVLIITEHDISELVADYGYKIFPVKENTNGMQVL